MNPFDNSPNPFIELDLSKAELVLTQNHNSLSSKPSMPSTA